MNAFKNLVGRVKEQFASPELSLADAKVLAMLAVIYADQKTSTARELGLLHALCSFDQRLVGLDLETAKKRFDTYGGDLHLLFDKLAESILEPSARMDIYASAFLLASIDGVVSGEELQMLDRLNKTLRMTLEETQMVHEHSRFVIDTLKELRILV